MRIKNKNNVVKKGEIKNNNNFYKRAKININQNSEDQIEKYNTINLS